MDLLHPLLKLTETISPGFEKHKTTGAVSLDIQKAFDRVWINGLTFNFISYNFPPPFSLTHLLLSYIINHTFTVHVNDTYSDPKAHTPGVVQGSLLEPILFNLYLNDIPSYTLTNINMYADDTSISACYKTPKIVRLALNKHLALLEKFFDKWKIKIHVEKSAAVAFTYKITLPPPPTLYNQAIPWSQETKCLGLIFDNNLTWKKHITYAHDKFLKVMLKIYPFINRNSHLDPNCKVLLYTAVLSPIIAYGCPVWGCAAKKNINILDVLQNTLIRRIGGACRCMRNDEIRNSLKIPSFKTHIQSLARNFFDSLNYSDNINMQNLENYTARTKRK
ncbi:RNA-directed DNA polymerase from mobile element jockey [Trichonephila clavipes]|nr:RNA-directed DNA polymerase from mobile element jockey [Trichonephila clavipes]